MPTGALTRRPTLTRLSSFLLLCLLAGLLGCKYVPPILNAPLKQWDPKSGYRFRSLVPPHTGNSDSLFIIASFEQIERLLLAVARLIRNDKDFQRLMQDLR